MDKLPVEILMKIFSYLQRFDNVSLVNRQFYNVACTMNDFNICLSLRLAEDTLDLQLLQSINNTNRQISKVTLAIHEEGNETEMRTAISIIKKFSTTIKCLKVKAWMQMPEFLEILSSVPNVEHLVFGREESPSKNQQDHTIMPSNEELNLHQLKTLEFWQYNEAFTAVLNRLPVGVLTELQIWDASTINIDTMNVLFKRQTNIKKLNLSRYEWPTIVPDIFDSLVLESFQCFCNRTINIHNIIAMILSTQTKMKSLELQEVFNGDVMNAVANKLTELETLSMNFCSTAAIENISKIKNLKNLTLQNSWNGMDLFARLDNSRITTLQLVNFFEVPDDLAKSLPNLKVFRILFLPSYEAFRAVMKDFNFVEVLEISPDKHNDYNSSSDSTYLIQADCFNAKLIELYLEHKMDYNTPFLEQLIADYPNLKKLVIASLTPITAQQLKLILKGFTKMESLSLRCGAWKLTVEDLNCLKDYKTNFKFISLGDFNVESKGGREKELYALFDVVSCRSSVLDMAVDKNTLKRERDICKIRGLCILTSKEPKRLFL